MLLKTAKDLIDHLLVLDPKKRYTCSEALNHKWVKDNTHTEDMTHTIEELKKFNARRKLRKAMLSVMAMRKLAKGFNIAASPGRKNSRAFSKAVVTSAKAIVTKDIPEGKEAVQVQAAAIKE